MTTQLKENGNGKKPKIAIFHFSGPPTISGVDKIIKDHARLFRLYNYKVKIVAGVGRQFRKDIPVNIIRRINPRHPVVFKVRKELENGIVSEDFYRLEESLYRRIKKYIIENNISVCILHNLMTRYYNLALSSAMVRLAKELKEVKFIIWVHDVTFYDDLYRKFDKALAHLFPWTLLVTPVPEFTYVCVSEFLRKNILRAFENKIPPSLLVIPNAFDIPKFWGISPFMRSFYQEIDGLESDLIAVVPVRAVPRKNLEYAIAIAQALIKKGVNFKLILTANVDYKLVENQIYYNKLKDMVMQNNLQQHVFFLEEYFQRYQGNKKTPAIPIPEAYLISDFLLLTSTIEGFGLPLLEAGILRCPIFASDIPPFREIGTTNINYFSLRDQPEKVADMILSRLRALPQSYFYRKILKNYSLQSVFVKRILPLVESRV